MTQYDSIDPVLSDWAHENGIEWYAKYQDADVRKFGLNMNQRDRVLVSVDVPDAGHTIIRIGQNRGGLSRLSRVENIPTPVSRAALLAALDQALKLAREWAAE